MKESKSIPLLLSQDKKLDDFKKLFTISVLQKFELELLEKNEYVLTFIMLPNWSLVMLLWN